LADKGIWRYNDSVMTHLTHRPRSRAYSTLHSGAFGEWAGPPLEWRAADAACLEVEERALVGLVWILWDAVVSVGSGVDGLGFADGAGLEAPPAGGSRELEKSVEGVGHVRLAFLGLRASRAS